MSTSKKPVITPPASPHRRPSAASEKEPQPVVQIIDEMKHVKERKALAPEPTYRWYDPILSTIFKLISFANRFLVVRLVTFIGSASIFLPWYFLYHLTEWPSRIAALLAFWSGGRYKDARENESEVKHFEPGTFARTPSICFKDIPEYNFEPNYFTFKGLRIHYVDLGRQENGKETLVFLHGNPSWSFMFRKVLWQLSDTYRVLAVDLIGFGKSDKLMFEPHSIKIQVDMFAAFLQDHLKLNNITLVLHDWGGQIGLSAWDQLHAPSIVKNLILLDTFLLGRIQLHHEIGFSSSLALATFQMYTSMFGRHIFLEPIIRFVAPNAPTSIVKGYTTPHPDGNTSCVFETFPRLVHPYLPIHLTPFLSTLFPQLSESLKSDEDIHQRNMAIRKRLKNFDGSVFILYGKYDHITYYFRKKWFGLLPEECLKKTRGRIVIVTTAGHFITEDDPDTVSNLIYEWLKGNQIEYSDKVHFI